MPDAPASARTFGPALVMGAGLLGAAGVGLSAVAAHLAGGAALAVAGSFCILHAAAALSIGLGAPRNRLCAAAGVLLLAGAALFAIGVAVHALSGVSLGPLAPAGGMGLIAGWLLVACGGVTLRAKAETAAEQP